jgi:hypothetical protein
MARKKQSSKKFFEACKIIHNNKYDYSASIYLGSMEPLLVICPKHGEFNQEPRHHLRKHGCPICCYIGRNVRKPKYSVPEFIAFCTKLHNNIYGYDKVNILSKIQANDKLQIFCKKCGVYFNQKAFNHYTGRGHKKCVNGERARNLKRLTTEIFIERSKLLNPGLFDYSEVNYVKNSQPVILTCNKCKIRFPQRPDLHFNGGQCPACQMPWMEKIVKQVLERENIKFKPQL